MHLQPGTLLQGGEYKIIRFIKSGGFGCTYEAYQKSLDRRVAIKEFFWNEHCRRDPQSGYVSVATDNNQIYFDKLRNKFIDEAKVLSRFIHPGIVRVSAVFEENGTAYYVMDYIAGCSLAEKIELNGHLPEDEALRYIRSTALTLQYIHNRNRLHLDIKPSNIMIDDEDNVILIDFGISKQYNDEGLNSSSLLGYTAGYAPLEQLGSDVRTFLPATDIYSLAATLYKTLTGCCPPPATDIIKGLPTHTLQGHHISRNTIHAICATMRVDKDDRPQNVSEFLALLDDKTTNDITDVSDPHKTIINQDETNVAIIETAPSPSDTTQNNHKERRNKNFFWIWLLLLALILGIGTYMSYKRTQTQNNNTPTIEKLEFKFNGKTYLVEPQEIELFAEEHPDATIILEKDGKTYNVKARHYQQFISGIQHVDTIAVAPDRNIPDEVPTTNSEQSAPTPQKIANGYINEHEWVDLGLPSGTKWATCNIGANTPEEYGNYYAWGEITPKATYTMENSLTYEQEMDDISGNAQYDAARAIWGGIWRMPTKAECEELVYYCTHTQATINGVKGSKLTSKRNGKSIFIPHAWWRDDVCRNEIRDEAVLWSSTPSINRGFVTDNTNSCCLCLLYVDWGDSRYIGYPIRPVCMGNHKEQTSTTTSSQTTSTQSTYKIGDYYDCNGMQGVVFEINDDGRHGKILSMDQTFASWCTASQHDKNIKIGATSEHDGFLNTHKVLSRSDCDEYPAFIWCRNKGNKWYIPSKKEFYTICQNEKIINETLFKHGGKAWNGWYLLSTEYNNSCAWHGALHDGSATTSYTTKNTSTVVRAISTF